VHFVLDPHSDDKERQGSSRKGIPERALPSCTPLIRTSPSPDHSQIGLTHTLPHLCIEPMSTYAGVNTTPERAALVKLKQQLRWTTADDRAGQTSGWSLLKYAVMLDDALAVRP
jgi:hypothetical protein